MKVGEAFWGSKEERCVDLVFVAATTPAFWMGRHVMRKHVPPELSVILEQIRVDMSDPDNPSFFPVHKLQTLYPGTETPFDEMARRFRKFALDETAQVNDIRSGRMTSVGPRPILLEHHRERLASVDQLEANGSLFAPVGLGRRWRYVLQNHRRGWLSTYGIHQHTHSDVPHEAALNAAMDIEDGAKDSAKYRGELLLQAVHMGLERRLR